MTEESPPSFPVSTGNIAWHLKDMALRHPAQIAIHCPASTDAYESLSYQALDRLCDQFAYDLRKRGIKPGMRTVLMVTPGVEFFGLVFALFKLRAVMVCVDPGMGINNIGKCLEEAQPAAFVGITKAHLARKLFGWAKTSLKINISIRKGMKLDATDTSIDAAPYIRENVKDECAAILFTSGSTGVPKGVVYHQKHFLAQVQALKEKYGIQPGEIDLCTFPLFALYAPALGMTAVIPRMNFTRPGKVNPLEIFRPIQKFQVTNLFGSPALLDRISRAAIDVDVDVNKQGGIKSDMFKLDTLKRVNSAGAPVPWQVLERMQKILPQGAQVFTPYGATESLPVCSIGSDEILSETSHKTAEGLGVCVGKPVDSINLDIIPVSDEPIEDWSSVTPVKQGDIGEITVHGPQVTPAYFGRDASTRLAKIQDATSEYGYRHRMGDLGYLDAQGRVWFCGRKSHRVIIGEHQTLYTDICEGIFNRHEMVYRTALVGVTKNKNLYKTPVICIELEKSTPYSKKDKAKLIQDLRDLAQQYGSTQSIQHFLFHPGFPVDIRHNAKIGREKLSVWAQRRLKKII